MAAPAALSLPGLSGPLPPISAGGGQSSSALNSNGSLYHASGDGDWVVNFGSSGGLGFGGFGSTASSGVLGSVAGGLSPLLLVALVVGAGWLLLKK
jgi:hypothetical protein